MNDIPCIGLVCIDTYYPVHYAQERLKSLSPSVYICVVKKHGCLLSYRSKIATK